MTPLRGWFVTGTDTGVGKTVTACALVRALRRRGLRVGVAKPVETGVTPAGPLDALALQAAAGLAGPIQAICPVALRLPAAPSVAARAEGRVLDPAALLRALRAAAEGRDVLVAEGAGGLRVPIAPDFAMDDLARAAGLPVLLVARGALGTLNHTRLSLEALERRGLPLAGVVISHAGGPLSDADAANLAELRDELGSRLVGELLPLAPGAEPPPGALDVDRLLAALAPA